MLLKSYPQKALNLSREALSLLVDPSNLSIVVFQAGLKCSVACSLRRANHVGPKMFTLLPLPGTTLCALSLTPGQFKPLIVVFLSRSPTWTVQLYGLCVRLPWQALLVLLIF